MFKIKYSAFNSYLLVLLFCTVFACSAFCQMLPESVRQITPGIVHKVYHNNGLPQTVHVVEIDWTESGFMLKSVLGKSVIAGRETVSSMFASLGLNEEFEPLVGVNADFFRQNGRPVSMQVVGSGPVTPPGARSVFFVDDRRKLYIDRLRFSGFALTANRKRLEIAGLNTYSGNDGRLSLFNRFYGEETESDSNAVEFTARLLSGSDVKLNEALQAYIADIDTLPEGVPIEYGSVVLKAVRSQSDLFSEDDRIELLLSVSPYITTRIAEAVGGAVRLVRNGSVSIENSEENVRDSFVTTRHPRTAVGFDRNQTRLFMIVADGRQPAYSIGMDLNELADFMVKIGVCEGLNLDGGGSTTLVIGGAVANRPSDITGERPVGNGLFVVRKRMRRKPE